MEDFRIVGIVLAVHASKQPPHNALWEEGVGGCICWERSQADSEALQCKGTSVQKAHNCPLVSSPSATHLAAHAGWREVYRELVRNIWDLELERARGLEVHKELSADT